MKSIPILGLAALLSACAASVISTSAAREVPPPSRFWANETGAMETLIVKRGTSFGGGGCVHRLYADARPVAELRTGEKVTFRIMAGRHIISVKAGCLVGTVKEMTIELSGGQTRTLFVDMSMTSELMIQETAF